MTKAITRFLLLGYLLIGLLVVFHAKADASGFSLSLDPPILFIQANPPSDINAFIHLTNHEDSEVTLDIDFAPFTLKDKTGEIVFVNEPISIAPFVKILYKDKDVREVSLASGQTIDLQFVANIPKDYQGKGEQYFSIVFSARNTLVPRRQENLGVYAFSQIKPGIATNVVLSIGPSEKIQKTSLVVDFQTQAFHEKGPVDFRLQIANHNKRAIGLQGEVFIQNLFGQTIGKIDFPLQYILAEKTRLYDKLSWPETVLIGPYRALLVLKDPSGQLTMTRTIVFLGLPYQTAISLFILFWVFVLIVLKIRQRLSK